MTRYVFLADKRAQSLARLIILLFIIINIYLIFFLTLKSFAIQINIRYESSFGTSLGIAGEQVTAFQQAWKKANYFKSIKYKQLDRFLGESLPLP